MVDRDDAERRPVPAMTGVPEYYPPPYYYEDEIDLRDYVNVLLKYWWLVVGVPLLALIVAGIYGFLIAKPGYQATALVAITSPRYIVQFAPEFETVPLNQRQVPLKAYPTLATSGELLQRILPKVSERLPEEQRTVTALRSMVSAKSGQDASIIELTVSSGDPELAAFIANIWADDFAAMVEEVYGQSASEIASFEEQLQQAEARQQAAEQAVIEFQARNPIPALEAQLEERKQALTSYLSTKRAEERLRQVGERLRAAEEAVIEFQARNPGAVLEAQLADKKSSLASYLATKRSIERVVQDAKSLRTRLSMQPDDTKSALGDDLSALILEVNSLSSSVSLPMQLQIQGGDSLSNKSVSEQITFFDSLVVALEEAAGDLDAKIEAVKPDILALQQQIEQANTEEKRLTEERDVNRTVYESLSLQLIEQVEPDVTEVQQQLEQARIEQYRLLEEREIARDLYHSLTLKLEEARLDQGTNRREVQVAARALPPTSPSSPRKMMMLGIAGALGLMVGVFAAFTVNFFASAPKK